MNGAYSVWTSPASFGTTSAAATTLAELQTQLDTFAHYYNDIRPHRALDGRTPLQAYSTRIKARPANQTATATHFRVREDKVDQTGTVTLRYMSKLHHIGIGRAHKNRPIKLLIADRDIRIIDLQTIQLLRELTPNPTRDHQPTNNTRTVYDVPRHQSPMPRHITPRGFRVFASGGAGERCRLYTPTGHVDRDRPYRLAAVQEEATGDGDRSA